MENSSFGAFGELLNPTSGQDIFLINKTVRLWLEKIMFEYWNTP